MEEKKVPWWRKALSFALDGIRSGFGLFSKSAKESLVDEPEIAPVQQGTPEETELAGHASELEPITAVTSEMKFVAVSEPAGVKLLPAENDPEHSELEQSESEQIESQASEPEGDDGSNPRTLASGSEDASAAEETVPPDSLPTPSSSESSEDSALPVPELNTPADDTPEASTESEVDKPAPQEEPETEALIEAVALGEPTTETPPAIAPKEAAEQTAEPEAAVKEVEPATEPATPEPVIIEETVSVADSVPEAAVSSVELNEPVSEEVTPQTAGQADAVEEESVEEVPPDPEAGPLTEHVAGFVTEPVTEQAAEEVAEEVPEPVIEPMELNGSIPERPAEPAEANEAVPVAEEGADEPVPHQEAPETAVEAPLSAEQAGVEQPAVDQAEHSDSEQPDAEPLTAVAEPAEAPVAEIEPAIAIQAVPEPAAEAAPSSGLAPATAPPHKPFIKLESRDNEADLSPFSVIVSQVYDGPLDLLLDLIRKQDIDIYDIPIARITAQFLAYVNQLKATDVDVAGEFIYTASLLIHIKSKMLLPRAPSGQDDAAEDPRRELVERLLEHERFKNAAQMLQQKQMLEAATWTNPGQREFQDDISAEPEIAADTVDLVRIFRDIIERARNRPVINVEEDSVTVGQMIQFLSRRLTMEDKPVALRRLLSHTRSERALIAMFLALLELVRLQAILLRQDLAFSEIFIKKHTGFEAVMNEGAASARDDWR